MYLRAVSDPPDVGDCSHLAGPQDSSQVHFLIPHGHKGGREMDVLQLTYSHTHIYNIYKKRTEQLYFPLTNTCGFWVGDSSILGLLPAICVLFFTRRTLEPKLTLFVQPARRIDRLADQYVSSVTSVIHEHTRGGQQSPPRLLWAERL